MIHMKLLIRDQPAQMNLLSIHANFACGVGKFAWNGVVISVDTPPATWDNPLTASPHIRRGLIRGENRSMTRDEDIAATKLQLAKIKENAWSIMRMASTADGNLLRAMGYDGKSNAEVVMAKYLDANKEIEKAVRAHEKRFPD